MPCNSTSAGCPYDSLNVGLTEPANPESPAPVAPSVGANPAPDAAYQDSQTAGNYCDGGLAVPARSDSTKGAGPATSRCSWSKPNSDRLTFACNQGGPDPGATWRVSSADAGASA